MTSAAPGFRADALDRSPAWFPHQFDPTNDVVLLLRVTEEDYRRASFLDQRAVPADASWQRTDWPALARAIGPGARRDAQYIFHIGNVGSTLISRLLGELPDVLALREPLLLRSFFEMLGPLPATNRWTDAEAEARLDTLAALLSRTFRPEQKSIVKATSFTSEIGWRLLPEGSRALFMFATPQHYVENILAGPNSRQTLELMSPSRLVRLQSRCDGLEADLPTLSEARKAALGWACEMSSLEQSAAHLPDGVTLWLDFDRFLADPANHLAAIAAHFGHELDAGTASAICGGPLMGRYSKALEYEFTPATRREILAEARWTHGSAIRDALGWLSQLGVLYPAVAQAIRRIKQGQ